MAELCLFIAYLDVCNSQGNTRLTPGSGQTNPTSVREKSPCTCPITGQWEHFLVQKQKQNWQFLLLRLSSVIILFYFLLFLCYRCHCPPQLEGPDCQQTRMSFLGNGFAWFPPIRPCFDSHLSLEFMTEEDDGLLLYVGPLATLLPGDMEDYMAIGTANFRLIRCVPMAHQLSDLEMNFICLIGGW